MSRTYRRRGAYWEYSWVLRELNFVEMRRALARFHSDAGISESGVPRWFRRVHKRRQRMSNTEEFRRWLANMRYDPVLTVRHRHSAQWDWW